MQGLGGYRTPQRPRVPGAGGPSGGMRGRCLRGAKPWKVETRAGSLSFPKQVCSWLAGLWLMYYPGMVSLSASEDAASPECR